MFGGSKDKAPSKQVDVEVRFQGMPKGFWSDTAHAVLALDYMVEDREVKASIENNVASFVSGLMKGYLDKEFPEESVSVLVMVRQLNEPSDVVSNLRGMANSNIIAGLYEPELSKEGVITIKLDASVSVLFFKGVGLKNPFFDEMRKTIVHELFHHYDIFVHENYKRFEDKLKALYRINDDEKFIQVMKDNPSYMVRTFVIFSRIEAVTVLNEIFYSGSKKRSGNQIMRADDLTALRLVLLNMAAGSVPPSELMSYLVRSKYPLATTMSLTVLFAHLDDLDLWREDLLNFLRTGDSVSGMPKINVPRDKLREVSEKIKNTDYRGFVKLYEDSAVKLGLREEEMVLTTAALKALLTNASRTNIERVKKELKKIAA
jgi:hypothetical protein